MPQRRQLAKRLIEGQDMSLLGPLLPAELAALVIRGLNEGSWLPIPLANVVSTMVNIVPNSYADLGR